MESMSGWNICLHPYSLMHRINVRWHVTAVYACKSPIRKYITTIKSNLPHSTWIGALLQWPNQWIEMSFKAYIHLRRSGEQHATDENRVNLYITQYSLIEVLLLEYECFSFDISVIFFLRCVLPSEMKFNIWIRFDEIGFLLLSVKPQ